MAFESCPECSTQKHQLVKCPQCGFQRNPHLGPIVVDVQPQREHHSRPQRDNATDRGNAGGNNTYQPRQRRSQHGLRQHDQRRSDDGQSQPHPNSYDYKPSPSERVGSNSRTTTGNSFSAKANSSVSNSRPRNQYNMQPRHNQFGQPIGGGMGGGGNDVLQEPRKPTKAAVITYKKRPRINRTETES